MVITYISVCTIYSYSYIYIHDIYTFSIYVHTTQTHAELFYMNLHLAGLQLGDFSRSFSLPCEGICLSPAECHCTGQEFGTGKLMQGGSSGGSVMGGMVPMKQGPVGRKLLWK